MKLYKIYTLIVFFFSSNIIFGATDESLTAVIKIMFWLTVLMALFIVWLVFVYSEKNDNNGELFLKPFIGFKNYATKMAPLDKENEILLDHDFDGIKELDNRVPPWFNFLFYGTMLFAAVYLINYHVIGSGQVQEDEYNSEMAAAQLEKTILVKSGVFLNAETVTLKTDPAILNEGKELYTKNCVSCHGNDGGGIVGPNLTDDYWIHGGGIKNVFTTISEGVPAKGMISWKAQLTPTQIQSVSSFVISLHGTNPANGKPAEGNKYIEADSTNSSI